VSKKSNKPVECSIEGIKKSGGVEIDEHYYRLRFVDDVKNGMELMKGGNQKKAEKLIKDLIDKIHGSKNEHIAALVEDLKGQVIQAFSREDWYKKWGSHYLPSLIRAHLLQQCNNFKDPGIQHYGGQLFRTLRDQVDDLFCKLPPPKPSIVKSHSSSYSAPVSSMSVYNSSSNPCFHGECLVQMADGNQKQVNLVRKGDRIMTPDNKQAEVLCVVKTMCDQGKERLVELEGGLLITAYHPVRIDGRWHFPCDLGKVIERSCNAVYSFVLKENHIMIINGIQCVTLGHNFKGEVVQHAYFGSKHIIEDLQKMRGWQSGQIQFSSGCMMKSLNDGLVCGFNIECIQ